MPHANSTHAYSTQALRTTGVSIWADTSEANVDLRLLANPILCARFAASSVDDGTPEFHARVVTRAQTLVAGGRCGAPAPAPIPPNPRVGCVAGFRFGPRVHQPQQGVCHLVFDDVVRGKVSFRKWLKDELRYW
eukprot:3033712-Prymnesium_polylepis.1